MDRRELLLKIKKSTQRKDRESATADGEEDEEAGGEILSGFDMNNLSDLSLMKLQKMMDESGTGGLSFFDESATDENADSYKKRRNENVSRYKQSLMQEYEEEMQRKHQAQSFKAAK